MINGNETIQKYKAFNKIYIPEDLNEETNKYTISGDTLTIISNNNCTTQNTQTTCDCTQYNIKYNVILGNGTYRCNRNPNTNSLVANEYITSDINYSDRVINQYTNNYIIYFAIIITMLLFTVAMKKTGVKI